MINFGLYAGVLCKTKRRLCKGNILINDRSGQKTSDFMTETAFSIDPCKKKFMRWNALDDDHF